MPTINANNYHCITTIFIFYIILCIIIIFFDRFQKCQLTFTDVALYLIRRRVFNKCRNIFSTYFISLLFCDSWHRSTSFDFHIGRIKSWIEYTALSWQSIGSFMAWIAGEWITGYWRVHNTFVSWIWFKCSSWSERQSRLSKWSKEYQ